MTDFSLQKVIKFKAGFRALQHIWKYNLFSCLDPVQDGGKEGITASSDWENNCVSARSFRWGIRVLFKERKKEVTAHALSFSTSTHVRTFQNDTLALLWAGKLFQRLLVLCRKHSNHSIFSNRRPFEAGLNHLTLIFYSGISSLHMWVLMLGCSKDINHRFDSLIERKHASDGKMTGCCWLHKCTHPL